MPQSSRQIAEGKQSALHTALVPRVRTIVDEILDIDKQIAALRDKRATLNSEKRRLKRILYEPPTFERRGSSGQELFVHVSFILPYIREWLEQYNNMNGGRGGMIQLQRLSGVSRRSIRNYMTGGIEYAGILSADRLLTAIGRSDIVESLPFLPYRDTFVRNRTSPQPPQPPPSNFYEE